MYLISACLCGVNCKYDGKNNINEKCLQLFREGKAIIICPEQLGGLETPRVPAEIVGTIEGILKAKDKVLTKEDKDVTKNFLKGALESVKIARETGIKKAILKDGSPSCGAKFIYDGTFSGKKVPGEGLTAYMLRLEGIEVLTENDI